LPYRALDAVLAHFMRFVDDERIMPVIWHQSLLAFVERLVMDVQTSKHFFFDSKHVILLFVACCQKPFIFEA
jgi:hypothetical protein